MFAAIGRLAGSNYILNEQLVVERVVSVDVFFRVFETQERLSRFLSEAGQRRAHNLTALDHAIGVGNSIQGYACPSRSFQILQVSSSHAIHHHFCLVIRAKGLLELIIIDGINHFCITENRVVFVGGFNQQRYQASHPTVAMDNIRAPAELFYRFQYASAKEYSAVVVILEKLLLGVPEGGFTLKIFLVINKINLHSGRLYGSYLNDERVIAVFDYQVHSGKANNLM